MKLSLLSLAFVLSCLILQAGASDTELKLITEAEATAIVKARREAKESRTQAVIEAIKSVPAIDERVIETGTRKIIVRRVSASDVEIPSPESVEPANVERPALSDPGEVVQRTIESISIRANVYDDAYSEIIWKDYEANDEFVVWTNISLRYLGPFDIFDDDEYQYQYSGFITTLTRESEENRENLAAQHGVEIESHWKEAPVSLSEDYYEYVVIADEATVVPEKLYRQLDVLLSEYLTNKTTLEISSKNARILEAARKKDLEENPPEPQDSVTNFWPGRNSIYLKKDK